MYSLFTASVCVWPLPSIICLSIYLSTSYRAIELFNLSSIYQSSIYLSIYPSIYFQDFYYNIASTQ